MSRLYITRFMDRLQQLESRGAKDFSCPMHDAKQLHSDITKLLLDLEQLRTQAQAGEEVIRVEMEGGSF